MAMHDWNDYRSQILARVGEIGKLSPDTVKGYMELGGAGAKTGRLDAKINAGHDPLSLGLGFPIGHRASPSVYLKQKTDIRSEEIFKSIPRYLVPKPLPRSSQ